MKNLRAVRSLGVTLALVASATLVPAAPAYAAPFEWSSTTTGAMDDAANWNPAAIPGAGDDVTLPPAAAVKALQTEAVGEVASLTVADSGYSVASTDMGFAVTSDLDVAAGAGLTLDGPAPWQLPTGISVGSGANFTVSDAYNFAGQTIALDNAGTAVFAGLSSSAPGTGGLSLTGAGQTTVGDLANQLSLDIAAGTLALAGASGDASVDADDGSTVAGTGTVATATIRGTLAPGSVGTAGVLTATTSADLGSTPDKATLAVDLDGTTVGSQYDQLSAGDVNIDGAVLDISVGYTPTAGDAFLIVDNTGSNPVAGSFAGAPDGSLVLVSGHAFEIDYQGGDGNDVTLEAVSAVYFTASGVGISESAGPMVVDVYRTETSGTATVQYSTVDGTATAPGDYTATSGTLTFGPGDSLESISVPLVADGVAEATEDFSVELSSPVGATLGAQSSVPVALYNDGSSLATWDGGGSDADWSTAANWTGDTVPSTGDQLVFPSGAAEAMNNDLGGSFTSVTFQAGGYTLAGDPLIVTNALTNSSGAAIVVNAHVQAGGDLTIATSGGLGLGGGLDIAGNDVTAGGTGALSVNATANSAPGAGGLTYSGSSTLTLSGANDMGRPLTIDSGALVFEATGSPGSSRFVTQAASISGNGSGGALAVDGSVNPGTVGGPGRLGASVLDLGGATVGLDLTGTVAASGHDQLRATSSVDLTGANLDLNTTFVPAFGAVFTIVDNTSSSAVTGTFAGLAEGAAVDLAGIPAVISYVGGDGNDVTLSAVQTIEFTTTEVTRNEAGGPVELTVTRSPASGAATVDYSTSNATAIAGQDYLANSGTLSFGDGESSKTIGVQILNDEADEPAETFTVELESPSSGARLGVAVATVSITDNDGAGDGYWMAATDGGVFAYGGAPFYGSMGGQRLNGQVVDIVSHESGDGYWLIGSDGGVFSYGASRFHGSTGGLRLNQPVLGGARTTTGNGYWLFAADGGVFAFGDAKFLGSTGNIKLNAPIVDMAATPSGNGYWLFASDGGVFAFGDARFFGSMGGTRLNSPVLGAARTPDGNGYWMTGSDGGVFAFGSAGFYGSTGGTRLNMPVRSIAQTESGKGYWLFATDGGVFAFGDAGFFGSMGGRPLNAPIIAGTSNS